MRSNRVDLIEQTNPVDLGDTPALQRKARAWAEARFFGMDDMDIYAECFIAGYRTARPRKLRTALEKGAREHEPTQAEPANE